MVGIAHHAPVLEAAHEADRAGAGAVAGLAAEVRAGADRHAQPARALLAAPVAGLAAGAGGLRADDERGRIETVGGGVDRQTEAGAVAAERPAPGAAQAVVVAPILTEGAVVVERGA